jgi:hypothetical protein
MEDTVRHHCLIYDGPPSRHLPAVAAVVHQKLSQNHRCLYLNTPEMVDGMRSALAADGVDVLKATDKGALVFTSEQHHLRDGRFDMDGMLRGLEQAMQQALQDGYVGLWASGDMTWEFGPEKDFSRLREYEWRLEEFIQAHPEFGGICQYHADTLPRDAMRQGLLAHPSVFINETLSLINPHYLPSPSSTPQAEQSPEVESVLSRLLQLEFAI